MIKKLIFFVMFCSAVAAYSQVSPIMGVGNIQLLDNNGEPCTACVLYSYQAGTTTQQATFTDSTATVFNPNPIPMSSGARANIWLTTGAFYKLQACLQNDGAFCAPADVLFSVDQVPGGASAGGGGGGGSPFIGVFISSSASPATSGILELAAGDTVCFRNTAGSANLCWRKDPNDLLSWDGGSLKFPEVGVPSGIAGFDLLWADNTAHRWMMAPNGRGASQFVASGVDINTSDQVTQLHFGSTAEPLFATAPTNSQFLQWNGNWIVGYTQQNLLTWCAPAQFGACSANNAFAENTTGAGFGNEVLLVSAHTLTRFTYLLSVTPTGCSTLAQLGVRDMTIPATLYAVNIANGTSTGFIDSGAVSVGLSAGHKIVVGVIQAAAGCTALPATSSVTMSYQ